MTSVSVKDNLVEEVLKIVDSIRAERTRVQQEPSSVTNETTDAYLADVQTLLCRLISSMISSPLSGRMSLMPPEAYITPAEREQSLNDQI